MLNTLCTFQWLDQAAGVAHCIRCQRPLPVQSLDVKRRCQAPAATSPAAPPPSARCLHLGDSLRKVDCKTCRGPVQLEVFACAKYGECTRERRGPEIAGCCKGCAYFEEAQARGG